MERFDDQPLRSHPHIAVLFQDKLGGFVAATPLLRGLKEKYPGAVVDYFGGERTEQLESACPYIDARYSLYGPTEAIRALGEFIRVREEAAGTYDLAINLDFSPLNAVVTPALAPTYVVGRCFRSDGRGELPPGNTSYDELLLPTTLWDSKDLVARYSGILKSNFIGEIFCRLARVATDFHRMEVPIANPPFAIPNVLIATGGTRTAKLWSSSSWQQLLKYCDADGVTVGLLGAAPRVQQAAYGSARLESDLLESSRLIDLRGRLTLPEVAGALRLARACVTIDNGIMHLAAAVQTPTLAIFGASPWEYWAPRLPWLHLMLPTEPCSLCRDNRYLNNDCLRERHVCLDSISPDSVYRRLQSLLGAELPA